jgi:hypothetical protein
MAYGPFSFLLFLNDKRILIMKNFIELLSAGIVSIDSPATHHVISTGFDMRCNTIMTKSTLWRENDQWVLMNDGVKMKVYDNDLIDLYMNTPENRDAFVKKIYFDSIALTRTRQLNLSETRAYNEILNARTEGAEYKAICKLCVLFGFRVVDAIDGYLTYEIGNTIHKMKVVLA